MVIGLLQISAEGIAFLLFVVAEYLVDTLLKRFFGSVLGCLSGHLALLPGRLCLMRLGMLRTYRNCCCYGAATKTSSWRRGLLSSGCRSHIASLGHEVV